MRTLDEDARGLVDPHEARRRLQIDRAPVSPELGWAVEHYWSVVWDLDEPYEQRIVPNPTVHVTFEPDGAFVTGVATGAWSRGLEGAGCVFGIRFRPAGFRPFLGRSLRTITDGVLPLAALFGSRSASIERLGAECVAAGRPLDLVGPVEAWLCSLADDLGDSERRDAEIVSGIVEAIAADPSAVRVGQVAEQLSVSPRRLQRLFAEHVGVNPKWVVDRARVHEVSERVRAGGELRWAELAAELGYADQAHLIRRFTEAVGEPPARYASKVNGSVSERR